MVTMIDLDDLDKYAEISVDDIICPHCGYSNPKWLVECEMCGTVLPHVKITTNIEDDD